MKAKFLCNSTFWSKPANSPTPYPLASAPSLPTLLWQNWGTAQQGAKGLVLNKVLGHKKCFASIGNRLRRFCTLAPASYLNTSITFLRQDDDTHSFLLHSVLLSASCTLLLCHKLQGTQALIKTSEKLARIFSFI